MLQVSHHHQVVPTLDHRVGGGIELHVAAGFADGQHDHVEDPRELHVAQRLGADLTFLGYAHLLNADVQSHVDRGGGGVQEFEYVRPQDGLGQAICGDVVGPENGVGAGVPELGLGFFLVHPRRHSEVRIQGFRRHDQEQVFRVGWQSGDESFGAIDAGFLKCLVAGRVGDHRQHLSLQCAFHSVFASVHDHERHAGALQLGRGAAAYPAEAAKNVVVLQFLDHVCHPPSAKVFP